MAARGKVIVPAGYLSYFVAEHQFFAEPKIVNTLPADAFDSIRLTATAFDDNEEGEVDRALAYLVHLKGLREVVLDKSDITDGGVAHLGELPNLQRVALFATNIDGSCLNQLSTIKPIASLRLSQTSLKAENIKYLALMPELKSVALGRLRLKDASMSQLSKCTKVSFLDLAENPDLSDNCLKYLTPLKKLRYLNVAGTAITLHGILQLKGMPIEVMLRSDKPFTRADLSALHQAFPGMVLAEKHRVKAVDSETRTIYAPFH